MREIAVGAISGKLETRVARSSGRKQSHTSKHQLSLFSSSVSCSNRRAVLSFSINFYMMMLMALVIAIIGGKKW